MEKSVKEECKEFHPDITCRVCGALLYLTDRGNHMVMYHCSSDEARYWDFERGTPEQANAKRHWEKSRYAWMQGDAQAVK